MRDSHLKRNGQHSWEWHLKLTTDFHFWTQTYTYLHTCARYCLLFFFIDMCDSSLSSIPELRFVIFLLPRITFLSTSIHTADPFVLLSHILPLGLSSLAFPDAPHETQSPLLYVTTCTCNFSEHLWQWCLHVCLLPSLSYAYPLHGKFYQVRNSISFLAIVSAISSTDIGTYWALTESLLDKWTN